MKIPQACDDLIPKTPEAFLDPELMKAWNEFIARYPYKKDCLDEIVSLLLSSGLLYCRKCKQQDWENLTGRLLKCLKCKTKRSATAATFFDHMRSYRAWLAAIWLTQRGIIVSSTTFQKLLNIAHSSARLILKRVMTAMKAPLQEEQDTLQVPTAAFIELFRRRSSETEARQSPQTEEDKFAGEKPRQEIDPPNQAQTSSEASVAIDQERKGELLSDEQRTILELLINEPLNSNQIASKTGLPITQISACLSMLEMDGLCKRLPGNLFSTGTQMQASGSKQAVAALSDAAREAVKALNHFILKKYKGISRKELQPYLTAYWCSQMCQRQQKLNVRYVLNACLKLGKKTTKDLFAEITPPVVRIYAPVWLCN